MITEMGDNWGQMASTVEGRTVDWGDLDKNLRNDGCDRKMVQKYFDDPNVLLVLVSQHQAWEHPKLLSVPLGTPSDQKMTAWQTLKKLKKHYPKKKRLLLINNSCWRHRRALTKLAEDRFTYFFNTYGLTGGFGHHLS